MEGFILARGLRVQSVVMEKVRFVGVGGGWSRDTRSQEAEG